VSDALNEDEWLAALLDRRLTERERTEIMAYLSAEAGAYEVFTCTAAVLRVVEEEADACVAEEEADTSLATLLLPRNAAGLDGLTAEFDALYDQMQTAEANAAADRALNASPKRLGDIAAAAERRRAH
jgi:hypothetical protein